MEKRKEIESIYHSLVERERQKLGREEFERKYSNRKYYSITKRSQDFLDKWIKRNCNEKVVLDYGCVTGGVSLHVAKYAKFVYGIDIAEERIKTASENLNSSPYKNKVNFLVMDAERMTFPNEMFDIVICAGVLHHLNRDYAYPEIARVLKPNGKMIAIEPLGYNPLIQYYRRKTPHLRTEWEIHHILKMKDVEDAMKYFEQLECLKFFHLFTLMAVPFRKSIFFNPFLNFLNMLDEVVLNIPLIQLLSWQMIFVLSKPRR
jgi:ubiquinone/menaquinone biosynthesis C-methylase UbiE